MPRKNKNDPFDYMAYMDDNNVNFFKQGDIGGNFLNFNQDNTNFGDFTSKPKGKQRKGRPKVSNNPEEFGTGLQYFGSALMRSEMDIEKPLRRGNTRIKRRIKEHKEKLQSGETLGQNIVKKVRTGIKKRNLAKKAKQLPTKTLRFKEAEREEPIRSKFKDAEDLR